MPVAACPVHYKAEYWLVCVLWNLSVFAPSEYFAEDDAAAVAVAALVATVVVDETGSQHWNATVH